MSSTGITYALTIPAGALQSATTITLTPILSHKNLPASGGFAAGADFQPAGLHFAQPVRLTAKGVPTTPSGMRLFAVTFEGDGTQLGLAPLATIAGTQTTLITHFSGASFVFGTTADLQALAQATTSGVANQPFVNALVALGVPTSPIPAALPILQAWFAQVILPQLKGAGTDAELLLATGDYELWHFAAEAYLSVGGLPLAPLFPAPLTPVSAVATEVGQAQLAVAPTLGLAIKGNNDTCATNRNLQALYNVLYWQQWATRFQVDSAAPLDLATVLAGLCAKVVEVSHSLANPLQVGFAHTLDVKFGLLFGNDVTPLPETFQVTVSAAGATLQNPVGLTDAVGLWGGSVVTAQSTSVSLAATACLLIQGTTTATPVCGTSNILSAGIDLTGIWSGIGPGTVNVVLTQNQNAITGTYTTVPASITPTSGTISGTLSGTSLLNFSLNQVTQLGSPCVGTLSGEGSINGSSILATVTGPTCRGQTLTFDLAWTRVTTPASLTGAYADPDPNNACGLPTLCGAFVWQFGNNLVIGLASSPTLNFKVKLTGTAYSGTGARNTNGSNCIRFGCNLDPKLTINGTIGGGMISGNVVDPIGGNFSFSLPQIP